MPSCSCFRCAACAASGVLPLAVRLLFRLGQRRLAIAPGLVEVCLAALLGLVERARVLGPLVGERLIELRPQRRELRFVRRELLGVPLPRLAELPVLASTSARVFSRRALKSSLAFFARSLSAASASLRSFVSASSRSIAMALSSRSAFARSSASIRSCASTSSLSFFEDCSLSERISLSFLLSASRRSRNSRLEIPVVFVAPVASLAFSSSTSRARRSASAASRRHFSRSLRTSPSSRSSSPARARVRTELVARLLVLGEVDGVRRANASRWTHAGRRTHAGDARRGTGPSAGEAAPRSATSPTPARRCGWGEPRPSRRRHPEAPTP